MTYKVLIVDDSKLARMAAIKALKACRPDWPRFEAGSAQEALTVVQRDAPAIALVDVNMPGGNGLQLVEDMRKEDPRLQIAIISANHQQEVVNRTKALGATFLPKPLAEEALRGFFDHAAGELTDAAR
jgi:YesN/AraC family two-component response regulator